MLAYPKLLACITTLCLTFFLTACPSTETPEPNRIPPIDTNGNVSVAAAQFVSLSSRMQSGLTLATARTLHMSNLLAEDVYGEPFIYLVFAAPRPINNLYTHGLTADASEWQESQQTQRDNTPWSTHYVGASNIRDVSSVIITDLDYLVTLADTVQSIGGEASIKRLVAFTPVNVLIETTDDRFVDPSTGRVVSDEEIAQATAIYDQLRQDIEDAGELGFPFLRQSWLCTFDSDECGESAPDFDPGDGPPYNFDVAALTNPDGTLDIPEAAEEIHSQLISP